MDALAKYLYKFFRLYQIQIGPPSAWPYCNTLKQRLHCSKFHLACFRLYNVEVLLRKISEKGRKIVNYTKYSKHLPGYILSLHSNGLCINNTTRDQWSEGQQGNACSLETFSIMQLLLIKICLGQNISKSWSVSQYFYYHMHTAW